jgi:hypothetical protein
MLAIDSARVRRGEDACQTPVFGDDCAADLMRGHVLEDHVESRARIDGVRLGHIGISNEELIAWREAHLGIESPFDIPVGENANERLTVEHRKVPDLVLDHQPASTTQAVGDIDRVRKGSHHRGNRRDMVHADCGFKPDAVEVPRFCEARRTRAGFTCARFRPGAESPASTAAAHVKRCDCRMLSTGMWIAIMESRLRSFR